MEKVLNVWSSDQTKHNIPMSQAIIQTKALNLFNSFKENKGEEAANEKFEASRGWFHRFKERSQRGNIIVLGESASAGLVACEKYPPELAMIIQEGQYSKKQIFNVDETGLYWKNMPGRTYIAKEEKSMIGFKAAKNRLTLLLGSNAAGDLKL